jgi:hypothetical protein
MPVDADRLPPSLESLGRVQARLGHVEELLAMLLIAAMAILVNMQIVAR